ncbi:MAG: gamma-glutamyl kinase [Pseudomonadota bacterium]
MLISLQARLAYLAMTKTGSTAIERALRPRCNIVFSGAPEITHMTARRYQRHLVPYLTAIGITGIETMAVLRHPVGWLASWYQYRRRAGGPDADRPESFEGFVDRYLAGETGLGRPWAFLRDQDQALGVNHLFRYEDFTAVERFLTARFGQEIAIKPANVSPGLDSSLPLPALSRLESALAEEFALYDHVRDVGPLNVAGWRASGL